MPSQSFCCWIPDYTGMWCGCVALGPLSTRPTTMVRRPYAGHLCVTSNRHAIVSVGVGVFFLFFASLIPNVYTMYTLTKYTVFNVVIQRVYFHFGPVPLVCSQSLFAC